MWPIASSERFLLVFLRRFSSFSVGLLQEKDMWATKAQEADAERALKAKETERQRQERGEFLRLNKFHFSPRCNCKGVPRSQLQVLDSQMSRLTMCAMDLNMNRLLDSTDLLPLFTSHCRDCLEYLWLSLLASRM